MLFRLLFVFLGFSVSRLWADGLTFPEVATEVRAKIAESSVAARFAFTNNSGKLCKITRMESECSCMTIETKDKKREFAPGETGELTGTFVIGKYTGTVNKTIVVWLEGDPKPAALLKVKVHIPEVVTVEPSTQRWPLNGPTDAKIIKIEFPQEAPARITKLNCTDANFTPTLKTIEEGRKYEIEIACASTATKALGVINVETDGALPPQKAFQVFAVVK